MSLKLYDRVDEKALSFFPRVKGTLAAVTLRDALARSQATVILCSRDMMKIVFPLIIDQCPEGFGDRPYWPRFAGAEIGVCENIPDRCILFLNQADARNPDCNVLLEVTE